MGKSLNLKHERQREALFVELYKAVFPLTARYVKRQGGTLDEAKDVFQDALVIYYEKKVSNEEAVSNDKAYVFGTSKLLWIKKYREGIRDESSANSWQKLGEQDVPVVSVAHEKIAAFLATTGQKCMNLLKAFYYDKLNLEEIASSFGYSGIRSATVQKYKCMEKIRETVKEKSLHYEDFVE